MITFQGLTDTDWLKLEGVQTSENRFETSCSACADTGSHL